MPDDTRPPAGRDLARHPVSPDAVSPDAVTPDAVSPDPGPPDPEGTDLARAVVAAARTRQRSGQGRYPSRRRGRWTGSSLAAQAAAGQDWSGPDADARDPQALSDVVGALVGSAGWGEDLPVHGVIARWDQVVGVEVAAHCRVERFDAGRLSVRTDSTAWATQLRLLAPTLLARIADEVGAGVVDEVFVLGPAAPSWARGRRRVHGRGPRDTYG